MRNFPKRLATATDIRNCKALVDDGTFEAQQLLDAIETLEKTNYLHCPITEISEDCKTITIKYCAEANKNVEAIVDGKKVIVTSVTHVEGEADEQGETELETSIIVVSAAVSSETKVIDITAPYSIYDSLGMTAEELNTIKEDLANE